MMANSSVMPNCLGDIVTLPVQNDSSLAGVSLTSQGGPQFINSVLTGNHIISHHYGRSETIYDWFSKVPYWKHHTAMLKGILEDSGRWLFEGDEFRNWRMGESTVLWLHGIPGSGKSRLAARTIQALKEENEANLAYFYCLRGESEKERSDPEEVLRSLLRQLAFANDTTDQMKDPVAKRYQEHEEKARKEHHDIEKFSIQETIRLLGDLLIGTSTTIVIDALDELNRNEEVGATRSLLFEAFDTINKRLKEDDRSGTVHLFLTSREDQDIVFKLSQYSNVHISAKQNQSDIERFIRKELSNTLNINPWFRSLVSKSLQLDIETTLISRAQGMFRWVSLQIDWLSTVRSRQALEDRLKGLPKTLAESYTRIFEDIRGIDLKERVVAFQTIHWLLCARTQLSIPDFITAVFIGLRMRVAKSNYRPSKEEVLSACQNLVVVDEELGIFRLAHLSVREFFEMKDGFTLRDANHSALGSCIFTLVDKDNDEELEKISEEGDNVNFGKYALQHWISHCEEIGPTGPDEPVRSMVERFIQNNSTPTGDFLRWADYIAGESRNSGQLELIWKNEDGNDLVSFPIFFASAHGLLWLVDKEVQGRKIDWNSHNWKRDTPLIVASMWGHMAMVKFLIGIGVEIDARGCEDRTALHMAARHGHTEIVKTLVENAADIHAIENDERAGYTPFHEAILGGHIGNVRYLLLVDNNPKHWVGARVSSSLTPLFLATKSLAITKLLVKHGADVHARDDKDDTPLHYATSEANQSMTRNIVSFLLQAGADISAENNEGITPLNIAAQNSDLLSLFVTHLDPSNPQYKSLGTSIIEAVLANSPSCLEILLKLGFDVNSINISRKTALDIALELASSVMLPTLLRYQAKPGLKWDVGSEFIQQWKNEEWFPRLIRQIKSTRIDMYIHQFFAYETVEREGEVVVNESSPDVPYLEVTVPSQFEDVQGVIFHVVSHDQGWSDQKAKWGGSYVNSSSFFEVGCKQREARHQICVNVHASRMWRINRQIWDVRNAAKKEWLLALKPGDVIQVFAKAKYPGWQNYVRYMRIELYGNVSVD